jgi:hypothetical protein
MTHARPMYPGILLAICYDLAEEVTSDSGKSIPVPKRMC